MMSAFPVKGVPLPLAWIAALVLAGMGPTMARAQGVVPSSSASASSPVGDPAPRPVVVPSDVLDFGEPEAAIPAIPGPPACVPGTLPARVVMGPLDVIHESIFGPASKEEWHPLSLSTFFSEGWDEAYVRSPEGTNEAPKQNWFGAADGVFVRLNTLNFFYTNHMTTNLGLLLTPLPWAPAKPKTNGNEYFASYNLYLPLNQRLELLIVAPFIASNKTSPTGHYVGNFGDLTVSARFRLVEQRNFSMQALLTERTPTGKTVNGNDINFITPSLEFWWNFAPKWVLRGERGSTSTPGASRRPTCTSTTWRSAATSRPRTCASSRSWSPTSRSRPYRTSWAGKTTSPTSTSRRASGSAWTGTRSGTCSAPSKCPSAGPSPTIGCPVSPCCATIDRARGPVASAASGRRRTGRAGRRTTTSLRPVASSGRFVSLVPRTTRRVTPTTRRFSFRLITWPISKPGTGAVAAAPRGRCARGSASSAR